MQPIINPINDKKELVFIRRLFSLKSLIKDEPIENTLKRGDIVSIVSPKNPRESYIKRIIGVPGDIVKTISYKNEYVRVPEGHCWIEGDNYECSYDSNSFGCVSMGLIYGQVKFIMFPRFIKLSDSLPNHRKIKILNDTVDKSVLVDFVPKRTLYDNKIYAHDFNDDDDDEDVDEEEEEEEGDDEDDQTSDD